jgi:hypothetical protein
MVDLDTISRELMIIVGIIMYILGFIGNLLNICVFTIWSFPRRTGNANNINNRADNISLYLLTTSVADFILILYPLLIRIYVDGYQHLITEDNSIMLCKFRYYVLQTSELISLICICLATFDRYLITSRNVRLRQLSLTRESTKKLILIIIILCCLHSIPIAVYYDRSSTGDCVIVSIIYSNYYIFFVIGFLYGILPICFLSIFGTLTYKQLKNLNQTNRNVNFHIDKQISRMLLLQCISLVFSFIPYCIQNIYFAKFASKDPSQASSNLLFRIITIILFYVNSVASFYIFFISTPNFRRQIKKILLCKTHLGLTNNQIQTNTATIN